MEVSEYPRVFVPYRFDVVVGAVWPHGHPWWRWFQRLSYDEVAGWDTVDLSDTLVLETADKFAAFRFVRYDDLCPVVKWDRAAEHHFPKRRFERHVTDVVSQRFAACAVLVALPGEPVQAA